MKISRRSIIFCIFWAPMSYGVLSKSYENSLHRTPQVHYFQYLASLCPMCPMKSIFLRTRGNYMRIEKEILKAKNRIEWAEKNMKKAKEELEKARAALRDIYARARVASCAHES